MTIGQALEDYNYGFYTTHDADSGDILVGTRCDICGGENFQIKTEEMRLADTVCGECRCDLSKRIKQYRKYASTTPDKFLEDCFGIKLPLYQRLILRVFNNKK